MLSNGTTYIYEHTQWSFPEFVAYSKWTQHRKVYHMVLGIGGTYPQDLLDVM